MRLFAIDPGTTESAYCVMDEEYKLLEFAKLPNKEVMRKMLEWCEDKKVEEVVIERMMSYGMPVGAETFISCEWIGRFSQEAEKYVHVDYIYRKDEKIYICGSPKAKDANIRAALIERFATTDKARGRGTKERPDYFYGVRADIWASIAIATTRLDMTKEKNKNVEKV